MLSFFALLALWTPILGTGATGVPGNQDAQEAVLTQLETALTANNPEQLVRALTASARIRDLRVARASTLALRNKNAGVQAAALDALRFNPHPRALPALHMAFKAEAGFGGRDDLQALLIQATAQHGDRSSLSLIAKGGFANDSPTLLKARILGLGRIRDKGSVGVLMNGMQTLPSGQRLLHMDEFRLALTQLTSEDHGLSAQGWMRWWETSGSELRLRSEDQPLEGSLQREWEAYWSRPTDIRIETVRAQPQRPKKKTAPRKKQGKPVEAGAKKKGKNNKQKQGAQEKNARAKAAREAGGKSNDDKAQAAAAAKEARAQERLEKKNAGKKKGKDKAGDEAGETAKPDGEEPAETSAEEKSSDESKGKTKDKQKKGKGKQAGDDAKQSKSKPKPKDGDEPATDKEDGPEQKENAGKKDQAKKKKGGKNKKQALMAEGEDAEDAATEESESPKQKKNAGKKDQAKQKKNGGKKKQDKQQTGKKKKAPAKNA